MIIKIKIKPQSKEERIDKISESEYFACLKERAEKGKANIALLKLLRKEFGKNAKIVKGKSSRNKIVEV